MAYILTVFSLNKLTVYLLSWSAWLTWLGVLPQSKGSPVRFQVRIRAWFVISVPSWGVYERQQIDVSLSQWCFSPSLSPSLPLSLKRNKMFKILFTFFGKSRLIQKCKSKTGNLHSIVWYLPFLFPFRRGDLNIVNSLVYSCRLFPMHL